MSPGVFNAAFERLSQRLILASTRSARVGSATQGAGRRDRERTDAGAHGVVRCRLIDLRH
jgi:hypothetical protein